MTTRRTFLKWIAGAVLSVTLAKQAGAVLPAKAEEPVQLVEEMVWIEDPYPIRLRFANPGEAGNWKYPEYVEIYPFQESCPGGKGAMYWPNPEYHSAPMEVRVGCTKEQLAQMKENPTQGVQPTVILVERPKITFEEVPAGDLPDFRFER